MPLLNFQGRFVDPIENDLKHHTLRNFRKYPIHPGDTLYLYTGLRTANSRKLGEAKCIEVRHVIIKKDSIALRMQLTLAEDGENVNTHYKVDRFFTIDELNAFAISDGFSDWNDMKKWWTTTHGLPWNGQMIKWLKLIKR